MAFVRSCSGCSGTLIAQDGRSEHVWCAKCHKRYVKPFAQWAAGLKVGDQVYVQPCVAWKGASRSPYIIREREGDRVVLSILGLPESRVETTIFQLGQYDLTPRAL